MSPDELRAHVAKLCRDNGCNPDEVLILAATVYCPHQLTKLEKQYPFYPDRTRTSALARDFIAGVSSYGPLTIKGIVWTKERQGCSKKVALCLKNLEMLLEARPFLKGVLTSTINIVKDDTEVVLESLHDIAARQQQEALAIEARAQDAALKAETRLSNRVADVGDAVEDVGGKVDACGDKVDAAANASTQQNVELLKAQEATQASVEGVAGALSALTEKLDGMSAALADRDALLVDLRAQVAALSPGAGLVVASPGASPATSIRATPRASATSSRSLEGLLFSAHTDAELSPRELARATRALMPRPALPNFESPQNVSFLETPKSKRLVHFAPQLIVASPNKENTSTPHPPTSRRVRSPIKADVEKHAKFIAFRRRAAVRSPRGVYTSENPEHVSPTDEDRAEARAWLIAAALAEAPET